MQTRVHKALRGCDGQELGREVEGTQFPLTGEESTESMDSKVEPALPGTWGTLMDRLIPPIYVLCPKSQCDCK